MEIFIKDLERIGNLLLDETILYYDVPQILSLKDNCNNHYICLATVENGLDKYICTPISAERLDDFKKSTITVYDIFKHPEINSIYMFNADGCISFDKFVTPIELSENLLPDNALTLNMLMDTNILQTEKERSLLTERDSIYARIINTENLNSHELPCSVMGNILNQLQSLFSTQTKDYYSKFDNAPEYSPVLNFCGTFPGSVGIKLKTAETKDLLGETKMTPIIEDFENIIDLKSAEEFKTFFETKKEYSYKLLKSFKTYLNTLISNNFEIEYKFNIKGSEQVKLKKKEETISTYQSLQQYLETKTFTEELTGEFVAIDQTKQRTFKFLSNDKIYSGKMMIDNFSDISIATKELYSIKINIKQELDPITNNLNEKYELISVEKTTN